LKNTGNFLLLTVKLQLDLICDQKPAPILKIKAFLPFQKIDDKYTKQNTYRCKINTFIVSYSESQNQKICCANEHIGVLLSGQTPIIY